MAIDLRGIDVTVKISIEGQPQVDTFERIKDVTLTPKFDRKEIPIVGRKFVETDVLINNWDVEFTTNVIGKSGFSFNDLMIERQKKGLPWPLATVTLSYALRDLSGAGEVLTYRCRSTVFEPSSTVVSNRDEHVTQKWMGNFPILEPLT